MKKILLINPYSHTSDHIQPPIGLGYLATSLKKNHFTPEILDANKEKLNPQRLWERIKKEPPDAVGFQCYSSNLSYVQEALEKVKTFNHKIMTLVGGPHPSALPDQIFQTIGESLDFGFRGEAEIGLPMLLKTVSLKQTNFKIIPGLIYRQNNYIFTNPPSFHSNLDDFDFPAWDLLQPETYPEAQHGAFFENFPIAPIITTRGCPFDCTFCAARNNSGPILRKRSVKNVIEEIKYLYDKHHVREFHIVDDNFTLDISFAKEVLNGIIELKLHASFAVPNGVRLDTLDEEILHLMKRAGFYLVSIGIESGNNRILRLMNKHLTTKQIKEKISLIRKIGLNVAGFFILGYPGETKKEIKKTINFSLNLGLLRVNYFLFLPLPGTVIFKRLKMKKLFGELNFNRLSFTKPNFLQNISKNRLKNFQREAFLRFYFLRPNILLKNLVKIKRPQQIFYLTKRAFHWLI